MAAKTAYTMPAIEWLKLIRSERLRKLALENSTQYPDNPSIPCSNIDEAISSAFLWHKTRQGEAYWLNVYNSKIALIHASGKSRIKTGMLVLALAILGTGVTSFFIFF